MTALPSTQHAAVYKRKGVIEIEQRPVPEPAAHEVLLEVSHCGVCGTDLHQVLEGWGIPDTVGGHEFSGVIVACGDSVEEWKIGDRVVAGPEPSCGRCEPCRAGRPALCFEHATPGTTEFAGAFTRFVPIDHRRLVAVPDGLDLRDAALTEPLAVSLHAMTRGQIATGDRVLIFGAGPIGMLALAALVAQGFEDVAVVEPGERRAELARQLGAGQVLHPGELDVPAPIIECNRIVADARHVVLETSGRTEAIEAGLSQLTKGGRLVLVGTGLDMPALDPIRILINELTITGAMTYDSDGFEQALALLRSGTLRTHVLAEREDVALPDILDAMQRLAAGEIAGKVLVNPIACQTQGETS